MTWDEVLVIATRWPGVEVGTSYGTPALKVRGKFLTRLRHEDDSLVFVDVGFDERELLVEMQPDTFHFTDHYRHYPSVLARLSAIDPKRVEAFLERRWRDVAPKSVVKQWDQAKAASPEA